MVTKRNVRYNFLRSWKESSALRRNLWLMIDTVKNVIKYFSKFNKNESHLDTKVS